MEEILKVYTRGKARKKNNRFIKWGTVVKGRNRNPEKDDL
jgi:hypothetical protein